MKGKGEWTPFLKRHQPLTKLESHKKYVFPQPGLPEGVLTNAFMLSGRAVPPVDGSRFPQPRLLQFPRSLNCSKHCFGARYRTRYQGLYSEKIRRYEDSLIPNLQRNTTNIKTIREWVCLKKHRFDW